MPASARSIVQDVLPRMMVRATWSGNYAPVLPLSTQSFELSAVLPAVFYMFRFGHRRGQGAFLSTFAPEKESRQERKRTVTIERVASKISHRDDIDGFNNEIEQAILGDLLLCFGLENVKRSLGRDRQVQRVAPVHYMASWIDLPDSVIHLRNVPEMIVAMLSDQKGDYVELTSGETRFPVGRDFEQNPLLHAFSTGIYRAGPLADLAADKFEEKNTGVGLDQLLMIRLAQQVHHAPSKAKGSARISNQRPIAKVAARHFSDDIRRFVRSYASIVPRHALVDMLESCVATGMTAILTSVIEILIEWVESGHVISEQEQKSIDIFVDCSIGVDNRLRAVAEQSMDDLIRRIEQVPTILTMLRLIDYAAKDNRRIGKQEIKTAPYATNWLNLLGDILHRRHEEASYIHAQMDDYGGKLAKGLEEEYPEVAEVLRNEAAESNAIRRFAIALTALMGGTVRSNLMSMVDSIVQSDRPNGLARKRSTARGARFSASGRRKREVRSLAFTDSVLDYLVHLHLLRSGNKQGVRQLSMREFLDDIRERYGFCVDIAPTGMAISNELLEANRAILERRLRDLGLLLGVNDAEAMKRLQPRFRLDGNG